MNFLSRFVRFYPADFLIVWPKWLVEPSEEINRPSLQKGVFLFTLKISIHFKNLGNIESFFSLDILIGIIQTIVDLLHINSPSTHYRFFSYLSVDFLSHAVQFELIRIQPVLIEMCMLFQ